MQNNFSIARLLNLAKLNFVIERRTLLVIALSLVGFMLLPYLIKLIPYVYGSPFRTDNCAESSFSVIFVLWLMGISSSLKPYVRRAQSSAALMLPATNGEKFSLIFVRTLIVNMTAMVAIGIAIQLLWSVAMGVPMNWNTWFDSSTHDFVREIVAAGFVHSLYLLGATIFRRNTFIYTSLCGLGILLLIGTAIGLYLLHLLHVNPNVDVMLSDSHRVVSYVVTISLTVAMWWLAWRRFTKLQLKK